MCGVGAAKVTESGKAPHLGDGAPCWLHCPYWVSPPHSLLPFSVTLTLFSVQRGPATRQRAKGPTSPCESKVAR